MLRHIELSKNLLTLTLPQSSFELTYLPANYIRDYANGPSIVRVCYLCNCREREEPISSFHLVSKNQRQTTKSSFFKKRYENYVRQMFARTLFPSTSFKKKFGKSVFV